ncbi:hypothetical protein LQG66_14850 [Bradyrhizobium ontarionense]|uniref:Uncharacterized protein n=1 Tax=Bradyrhizobium ontarionense TaxID=2898149 RepID=A0ABY3RK85_9BRAD|nr:hypothetical protein [Bradyrhizobium sp. A19]UFZ07502.1 hypothetical protein LQG66_14850 [Bradyrhizobium sp. A19]
MTTETDLWQTAWIIAEQHGTDGPAFAARMADSFKLGHKIDAHQAWVSIAAKVAALIETNTSRSAHRH